MTIVRIDDTQLTSGLEAASKIYSLIAPVKDKTGNHRFKNLDRENFPDFCFINTTVSPKEFLFPQSEEILEYSTIIPDDILKEVEKNYKTKAILGIRPCDAKANNILKMNFDTPSVKDPYWVKAYESTTFIGLACDNPCNSCFCTTTGSSPYGTEGLDIILTQKKDDQYLAKIITQKGEKFASEAKWQNLLKEESSVFEERKIIAEKKISSKIFIDKLPTIPTLDLYGASFWDEVSFSCLNCGICTFICPTCWCFDIQDEVHAKTGVRMKNWDSCMFPIFTVHTTGHNPRGTKKQRVRQRFMHKLKYFNDKYKKGPMCVGCGRCVQKCPVNIDIRKICNLMNNFKSENSDDV